MTRGDYEKNELVRHAKTRIEINLEDIRSQLHEQDWHRLVTMANEVRQDLELMKELNGE